MQDLSFFTKDQLAGLDTEIVAGQCSCAIREDVVSEYDVIFSSIPSHIATLEKLGTRAVFLALAFDPVVLESVPVAPQRTHVAFVGGYGWQWEMDELFTVLAERTPIQFWGYGFEKAPMVVRNKWHGPAWGRQMYEIYLRSLIVVNRHGGISQGMANNLRLFEATGCGAMLLTEDAPNLEDYFDENESIECLTYESPEDCAATINRWLERPDLLSVVASKGQQRTLSQHTYFQRMPIVANVLSECLNEKKVSA